jgi:hypothetical protein
MKQAIPRLVSIKRLLRIDHKADKIPTAKQSGRLVVYNSVGGNVFLVNWFPFGCEVVWFST